MNFPVVFKEFANFRRFAPKIAKKCLKCSVLCGENFLKKLLKRNFTKIAKNDFFTFSPRKMLKIIAKKIIFAKNGLKKC